ncbi:hypothetical protein NDI37_25515 [Funiculus sociatus GB2-A5]|uniref:Uncharacterized protein n=1 Tax=Funiculus sociatus GB2-A5 TaxID=2933946 RepID=A0ABV0JWJ8_9CYAN|nr:hypothetical protein [Trichocoleus sp. FACHB-6]MBD2060682.1 hypothetical protein [Trichocoleus sp. FACHB-6]
MWVDKAANLCQFFRLVRRQHLRPFTWLTTTQRISARSVLDQCANFNTDSISDRVNLQSKRFQRQRVQ